MGFSYRDKGFINLKFKDEGQASQIGDEALELRDYKNAEVRGVLELENGIPPRGSSVVASGQYTIIPLPHTANPRESLSSSLIATT